MQYDGWRMDRKRCVEQIHATHYGSKRRYSDGNEIGSRYLLGDPTVTYSSYINLHEGSGSFGGEYCTY